MRSAQGVHGHGDAVTGYSQSPGGAKTVPAMRADPQVLGRAVGVFIVDPVSASHIDLPEQKGRQGGVVRAIGVAVEQSPIAAAAGGSTTPVVGRCQGGPKIRGDAAIRPGVNTSGRPGIPVVACRTEYQSMLIR